MTLPHLKDFGIVGGMLLAGLVIVLAHIRQDLSLYALWPEALRVAALCALFHLGGFVLGYTLAWSRREDAENKEVEVMPKAEA